MRLTFATFQRILIGLFLGWALSPTTAAQTRTLAVQTDLPELENALARGVLQRWILPESEDLRLEVGPAAQGEITVEIHHLPDSPALTEQLELLPVAWKEDQILLGETAYRAETTALALRLPESESRFLVLGQDIPLLARLADQILIAASGSRWHSLPKGVDYLVWEHRWSHRSGRWQTGEAGYGLDPNERDDPKNREAFYARLTPLKRQHLILRVPKHLAEDDSMTQLADDLDKAVAEMATRVPIELEAPIEILLEESYFAQGKHLAEIGAAILRPDGRLHIVYDPRDLDLYRYELARALIRLAGGDLVPWIEDGAALWLARDWYGRKFEEWIPDLAFARILPQPADLLVKERQESASTVLWPIVTAGVLERMSGKSLASKLLTPPNEATVRSILIRHLNGAHLRPTPPVEPESAPQSAPSNETDTEEPALPPPPSPPPFYRGISFAMANGLEVGYHGTGIDAQLKRFAKLGADSVSLMPFAYQPRFDQPELRFLNRNPTSETDVGVIHAARRAHENGFSVLWKPHIWVSHESWPGDIAMTSERDWQKWWFQYRTYLLHHSILAQSVGSELLSIGVELGKTVDRAEDWRHLIDSVRRVYRGKLTYAGNWWDDYEKVTFWDSLDFIGVDAYFPLSSETNAQHSQLLAGAKDAVSQIARIAQKEEKSVLLTEVGFSARESAWIKPHTEGGTFSEADQNDAYRAFLKALGHPAWLSGLYVWKAFSHKKAEGGERPDFRFLGRKAEAVVTNYFKAEPTKTETATTPHQAPQNPKVTTHR